MLETVNVDTSPLSQSYLNTYIYIHKIEEKLYAKIFDPAEF